MKLDVFDTKGKALEQVTLDKNVFGVKPNEAVLLQYIHVYRSNQRQGTASSKTRSEVSGGGKKPWRQKGTGRARVGSSRNPLWRHGGISHGPKPKDWSKTMTKKLRKLAMKSALSLKSSDKKIKLVKTFGLKKPGTKELLELLTAIDATDRKVLLVLSENDSNVKRSAQNIPGVKVAQASNVNPVEILDTYKLVFDKGGLKKLEKRLSK